MGFTANWFCPSCANQDEYNDVICSGGWMICKCPVCKMRFQVFLPDAENMNIPLAADVLCNKAGSIQQW